MSKRKVLDEDSDIDLSSTDESDNEVDKMQNKSDEEEVIDVDFDYFDLDPTVDFHATKTFLRQLFGDDANKFDISGLADMILSKNSVGTTIKTDGNEGDPFAVMSVLDMTTNATSPTIKPIIDYTIERAKGHPEFQMVLKKLLLPGAATGASKALKVGWIVSERMINMPVEVVPPMYKMLLQEMEKAEDAHEKYEFDYFLVISKIYKLVKSNIDEEEELSKKKRHMPAGASPDEFDYFHYEDIVLEGNAKYHTHCEYIEQHQDTDSRRVFTEYGIDPRFSVILLDKKGLAKSVPEMEEKFPPF